MLNDLKFVIKRWRIIHLMGISKLRERYARSKLGQFWLTLSNLILIIFTGFVWSIIWKIPLDEYLPYIGVGHVTYLFISQTLNESTGIFVSDARYYINQYMPFFTSVLSHIYRNTIIFLHNIPLILALVIWSKNAYFNVNLLFFLSVFIMFFFLFSSCYVIAAVSTRFRDIAQIFGLIFQLAFLITPVMWKISFIPQKYQIFFIINPLAAFLELLRNPLIGLPVLEFSYYSALIWTMFSMIVAIFVYKKFDKKIIFWV